MLLIGCSKPEKDFSDCSSIASEASKTPEGFGKIVRGELNKNNSIEMCMKDRGWAKSAAKDEKIAESYSK